MFDSVADEALSELEERKIAKDKLLPIGIGFLDDALRGIFPDDLFLIGAYSGQGKTQLCCNIALANIMAKKRVHYIALEASKYEITRRIKYQIVANKFFSDPNRPSLDKKINFVDWRLGDFMEPLKKYEAQAISEMGNDFQNLMLYSKTDRFGLQELIESVIICSNKTDLILIDHVHYFDFDDHNENRALKEIAKTVRMLALENGKPIILVAHLRKRDKGNEELIAGLDEFHGSSDLCKIATRVVTMAPGPINSDGNYETFFRIPKDRLDGGNLRYSGRVVFNPKKGSYEKNNYSIGWSSRTRKEGFEPIDRSLWPTWARGGNSSGVGSYSASNSQGQPKLFEAQRGKRVISKPYSDD